MEVVVISPWSSQRFPPENVSTLGIELQLITQIPHTGHHNDQKGGVCPWGRPRRVIYLFSLMSFVASASGTRSKCDGVML